jgi:hypothetical protein
MLKETSLRIFKLDMSCSKERQLMKINIFPHTKPCRITDVSNELAAGRHLRNRSITVVEDRIEDWGSNEFNEINSLDNSAVNQEVETDRTVMSGCEGKYSDSTVTTDASICQLGNCKTTDQCYCYYSDRHYNNDKRQPISNSKQNVRI